MLVLVFSWDLLKIFNNASFILQSFRNKVSVDQFPSCEFVMETQASQYGMKLPLFFCFSELVTVTCFQGGVDHSSTCSVSLESFLPSFYFSVPARCLAVHLWSLTNGSLPAPPSGNPLAVSTLESPLRGTTNIFCPCPEVTKLVKLCQSCVESSRKLTLAYFCLCCLSMV